jgi:hypothetical protein
MCRVSKLKHPFHFDNEYFSGGHVPLDLKDIEVIFPLLEWS